MCAAASDGLGVPPGAWFLIGPPATVSQDARNAQPLQSTTWSSRTAAQDRGLCGEPRISLFAMDGKCGVKQQGCHGRWKRTSWHFLLGKVFEALEATTPISSFSPILSCPSTAQALSSYFPLCQWRAPHFVCPSVHPSIQHSVSTYFAHTLVQLLGSEEEAVIEHGETYPNK